MGKGGIILGIIGLILGASGLGFGVVNFMNQPTNYYSYYDLEFYPSPALEYRAITNIAILFAVGNPVSLHLLFTCSARCYGDAVSFSDLHFYFMINGVLQTDMPWARTGSFQSSTDSEYTTVSLQHYFTVTVPGIYNITVVVLTERAGNFIRQSSLWIQSTPA